MVLQSPALFQLSEAESSDRIPFNILRLCEHLPGILKCRDLHLMYNISSLSILKALICLALKCLNEMLMKTHWATVSESRRLCIPYLIDIPNIFICVNRVYIVTTNMHMHFGTQKHSAQHEDCTRPVKSRKLWTSPFLKSALWQC